MSIGAPFLLRGRMVRLAANNQGATVSPVQAVAVDGIGADNYSVTNLGPDVAFLGYGPDAITAANNAAIPTVGSVGQYCVLVLPGQTSISAPPNAYFAAICPNSTADIYIEPGDGTKRGGNLPASAAIAAQTFANNLIEQQFELLQNLLIELRTLTHFLKEGLNVPEDPDAVRSDQAALIN